MKNKKPEYGLLKKVIISIFFVLLFFPAFAQNLYFMRQQCYGTVNEDQIDCLAYGENNGYYLGITITQSDSTFENYHGMNDIAIIKTDSAGNILWQKCYGGSNNETLTKIININDTTYYLVGHTNSTDGDVSNNKYDGDNTWVVKIDNNGNIIWEKCIGGMGGESEKNALLTTNKGILVLDNIQAGGGDISNYYGSDDIWLCKLSAAGNKEWETTLGNEDADGAGDIIYTSNGTLMMIGYSSDTGGMVTCRKDTMALYSDVWLLELDTTGNILKQYCYGGSYNDKGVSIVKYENGYVFAASTNSKDMDVSGLHGNGYQDYWVVKVDSTGTIVWQKCIGSSNIDEPVAIFKRGYRGYMVFGYTYGNDGDVSCFHGYYGTNDVFVAKLNNDGYLLDKMCIGSNLYDVFNNGNQVIQKDKYYYSLMTGSTEATGNIGCAIEPPILRIDNTYGWFLSLKDCSGFVPPPAPETIAGPAIFCTNKDSVAYYNINPIQGALGYEWLVAPPDAGTFDTINTTSLTVRWSNNFEGAGVVFVRTYDECHHSQWSPMKTTDIYNCTGINEHNQNGFPIAVYPNPADNILNISIPENTLNTMVEIIDINGKTVLKSSFNTSAIKLNISGLKKGLYLVKIQNTKGIITKRIIKR